MVSYGCRDDNESAKRLATKTATEENMDIQALPEKKIFIDED